MAPAQTQDAKQTNHSPTPESTILDHASVKQPWSPASALDQLQKSTRPRPHTASPVSFFHLLERLKTTRREGWRRFGIEHGESISDHMYRMSIITMLAPPTLSSRLNIPRCTQMALVHDMAETLVGDITPIDGMLKSEKSRREAATIDYICQDLLGDVDGGVQGRELKEVWYEYEDGETLESRFVHDVDKIELVLQMLEYERSHAGKIDLGEFSWVAQRIMLPEVKQWCAEVLGERAGLWKELGKVPTGSDLSQERQAQQNEYYGNGEIDKEQ